MAEFYDVYRGVLAELGQADRLPVLEAHVARRGSAASIADRLARAGFEVTAVVPGRFRMRFADGAALLAHHFIRLGFVDGWREIAAEGTAALVFERLATRLDELATERGGLELTIPMACFEARKPPGGP
jgi:arsenite methyltransferase